MVARLKLKGIDGRAPPGVIEIRVALAPQSAGFNPALVGHRPMTLSNCGEVLRARRTKAGMETSCWPQSTAGGMVTIARDEPPFIRGGVKWIIRSQALRAPSLWVQSTD
jgi:hypothetical protein